MPRILGVTEPPASGPSPDLNVGGVLDVPPVQRVPLDALKRVGTPRRAAPAATGRAAGQAHDAA